MSKKYTTVIRRDDDVIDFDTIDEVKKLREDLKLKCLENEKLCNVVKEIQNSIVTINDNSEYLQKMLKDREEAIKDLSSKLSDSSTVINNYEEKIIALENSNKEIQDNIQLYKDENKLMYDNLELYIKSNTELKNNYDTIISSYKDKKDKCDKLDVTMLQERQWFLMQIDNLQNIVINLNKVNTEKDDYIFQQDKIIKEYLNIFLFSNETYFMSQNGDIINIQSENEFNDLLNYNGDNAIVFFKNTLIELFENAKKLKKELELEIYKNIIFEQSNLEMKKLYGETNDSNIKMSKENVFLKKKVNAHGDKTLMEEFEKEIALLNEQIQNLKQENEDTVKKYNNILAETNNTYCDEINKFYEKEQNIVEEIKKYDHNLTEAFKKCDALQNIIDVKTMEMEELQKCIETLNNKKEKCTTCEELHNEKNILETRIQQIMEYGDETDNLLKHANITINKQKETIKNLEYKITEIEKQESPDDNIVILNKKIEIQNGIINQLKDQVSNLKDNEILIMKDIADTTNVKIDLRNEINVLKQQEILYQCEKEDNIKELKKQKDYNNGLKDIVIKYRNVLNSITSNIHDHEKIANIIRKEQDNFEKNNFNFV